MKFLIDQSVSPLLATWLQSDEAGRHDALHVRDRGMSSATDDDIFALAQAESRVVVTADLDFARIVALRREPEPGLILFRAGNVTDQEMLGLLRRVLVEVDEPTLSRSVVVIDESSIRVASLPIKPRS